MLLIIKIFFFFLINYFFCKYTIVWCVCFFLYYYLHSSFIFFIKKYKFSKFTSAIKRFWRRSFTVFWVLEALVFGVLLFCLFTAPFEPIYCEEKFIYKYKFSSNVEVYLKQVSVVFYGFLIFLFSNCFLTTSTVYQLVVFCFLFFCFFLICYFNECNVFLYVISFFWEYYNNFLFDKYLFTNSFDYPRFKPRVPLYALILMVKFWHLLVIFICVIFFFFKILECRKVVTPMYAFTTQNMFVYFFMVGLNLVLNFKLYFKIYFKFMWFWFFKYPIVLSFYI